MEIINRTLRIMRATDGTVEVIMVSHDDCGAHKEANLAMSDLTRRQIHEVAEEAMIEEATASGLSFHHMVVDNNPSGDHGSCVIDSWVSSPAGAGGSSSW